MSTLVPLALLGSAQAADVVVVHHHAVRPRPVVYARPVVVYRHPVVWTRPVIAVPIRAVTYVRPPPVVTWEEDLEPAPIQRAPEAAVVEPPEDRGLDRADTVAVGIVGGSFLSTSPASGELYGDPGLGLVGRWRPSAGIGLELGLSHHLGISSRVGEDRAQTQLGGQVKLFAWPSSPVSPYALGGAIYDVARFDAADVDVLEARWGLDGGLGVEVALGQQLALDLEAKLIGWTDGRAPGGALQSTAGLLWHFR